MAIQQQSLEDHDDDLKAIAAIAGTSGILQKTAANTWSLISRTQSKSFVITNPTASSDGPLWRVPYNITIVAVHLLCKGNVVVGQLDEMDSNGLNPTPVDASDITGVVDTNVNDDGSLTNPGIDSGNYIGWHTTSVTLAPTKAIITFDYTID